MGGVAKFPQCEVVVRATVQCGDRLLCCAVMSPSFSADLTALVRASEIPVELLENVYIASHEFCESCVEVRCLYFHEALGKFVMQPRLSRYDPGTE